MTTPWIIGVIMLAIAGFTGWLVLGFLGSGVAELVLFRKQFFVFNASQSLTFDRDEQPTMFWFTVGFYSLATVVVAGLGIWQFFR